MPLSLCPTVVCRYTKMLDQVPIKRAVVTFDDQPGRVGGTLCELSNRSIPISWVSTGPMLPDDLVRAEISWLKRLITATTEDFSTLDISA